MRIWLSTAPLAFRLKGAGGGTVDNPNQRQGLHLRNPKTCPNKPGHLSIWATTPGRKRPKRSLNGPGDASLSRLQEVVPAHPPP